MIIFSTYRSTQYYSANDCPELHLNITTDTIPEYPVPDYPGTNSSVTQDPVTDTIPEYPDYWDHPVTNSSVADYTVTNNSTPYYDYSNDSHTLEPVTQEPVTQDPLWTPEPTDGEPDTLILMDNNYVELGRVIGSVQNIKYWGPNSDGYTPGVKGVHWVEQRGTGRGCYTMFTEPNQGGGSYTLRKSNQVGPDTEGQFQKFKDIAKMCMRILTAR